MIPQVVDLTELRQNLPGYLDRVETGGIFLVTVRGKVVALIQPEIDEAEAAYQVKLSYRHKAWIGDVMTPRLIKNGLATVITCDTLFSPAIAVRAQARIFQHKDPANRLIAATAMELIAPLITQDRMLAAIPDLRVLW